MTYIGDITGNCNDLREGRETEVEGFDRILPADRSRQEDRDVGVVEAIGQGRAVGIKGGDKREEEGEGEREGVHAGQLGVVVVL